MTTTKIFSVLIFTSFIFISCDKKLPQHVENEINQEKAEVFTKEVTYDHEGTSYKSFAAFPADSVESKPVIFIIPEWWGLNEYAKDRANQLAEMGYFTLALDFYGNGKVADNPEEAKKLSSPFYENPALAKKAFDAAKEKLSDFPNADKSKIVVIGYCFGGAHALNMARQDAELKGAVSFHGSLMTGVKPTHNSVPVLVLNGEADEFVPQEEIEAFKTEMDSAQIKYKFVNYPGAMHAFTNPAADEAAEKYGLKVAYNKEADLKSWEELKVFLTEVFE